MRIIIFNGPPNCGKDEAVRYLVREYSTIPFSFKNRLKKITLDVYGVDEQVWDSWYTREGKELPRKELDGKSCREALIHMSEVVIKPSFGKDYFGRVEARSLALKALGNSGVAACSDGGFNEEIDPLVDQFGKDNVFLCQIHRPGCSFEGDSRTWIDNPRILIGNRYQIVNEHSLDYYWKQLDLFYKYVMNQ